MRNDWKFSLLEMIDNEPVPRVKMAMILDGLEKHGKNPISNYPYLYLLERAIKEVGKRNWVRRDHLDRLKRSFYYLKEGVIDRTFLDEEKDRKDSENGVYCYFVESPNFKEMFEEFIQAVRNLDDEW